jgi:hypothetical protein
MAITTSSSMRVNPNMTGDPLGEKCRRYQNANQNLPLYPLSDFFVGAYYLLFGPKPPRFVERNIVSLFLGKEQLAVLTAKGVERRKSHWAWDLSDKLHRYVALRTVGHLRCHFFTPATATKARPEFPPPSSRPNKL